MSETVTLYDYVKPELIEIKQTFSSEEDLFSHVYEKAKQLDWVTETFIDKIIAREKEFPTGMQLENVGVAIPHTDPECINKEFVAVLTLEQPVAFNRMDDPTQSVETKIVFVLGLNQPHAQLEMLQSLMGLMQNESVLNQLIEAKSNEEIIEIIQKNHL